MSLPDYIHQSKFLLLISGVALMMLFSTSCLAQGLSELSEPEIPEIATDSSAVTSSTAALLPEPVLGDGRLSISIESFKGANPRRISRLADRVEVWLGDRRLASLDHTAPEVVKEKNRRIFLFPELTLANGYYFVTVRLYSHAVFYGRDKWHGETFQVGIHPERTSRVYKKIAFFHY
jgi:hypothetical protein